MSKILIFIPFIIIFVFGCTYFEGQEKTNFYGVIIGINDYNDPSIRNLDWCINDADCILSALLENGWKEDEITVLRNGEALKNTIINTLRLIVERACADDYIFIYYSGHGTYIADTSGDEDDGNDETLIPVDAVFEATGTYLTDDELGEIFSECKTEKGIFIFDACNSGGLINKGLVYNDKINVRYIESKNTSGSATNGDLDIITFPVMTASRQSEYSWEDSDLEHGVFTYFLLEGFTDRNADRNEDGYLTIRELFHYAKIHTESYVISQHPQLRYPWDFMDILVTR